MFIYTSPLTDSFNARPGRKWRRMKYEREPTHVCILLLTHVSNTSSYARIIIIVTKDSFVSSESMVPLFGKKYISVLLIYAHPHPSC